MKSPEGLCLDHLLCMIREHFKSVYTSFIDENETNLSSLDLLIGRLRGNIIIM